MTRIRIVLLIVLLTGVSGQAQTEKQSVAQKAAEAEANESAAQTLRVWHQSAEYKQRVEHCNDVTLAYHASFIDLEEAARQYAKQVNSDKPDAYTYFRFYQDQLQDAARTFSSYWRSSQECIAHLEDQPGSEK